MESAGIAGGDGIPTRDEGSWALVRAHKSHDVTRTSQACDAKFNRSPARLPQRHCYSHLSGQRFSLRLATTTHATTIGAG